MGSQQADRWHILYITADEDHGSVVTTHLESTDEFAVTIATSGPTGLDVLETAERIDCVLSADTLPDMAGMDLLDAVQEIDPTIPIVFYPREGSEELVYEALEVGATEYISRSDAEDHLVTLEARIREAIEEATLEAALSERVKELQSIQRIITTLVERVDSPSDTVYRSLLGPIRQGFQVPSDVAVWLTVGDAEFTTGTIHPAATILEANTTTQEGETIRIKVGYRDTDDELPETIEEAFLEEEQEFLEVIVRLIRVFVDRRTALGDLVESEKLFRELAENLREVVWVTDPEKERLLYVNPAYEHVWGLSRESLHADPESFIEAIHPEDRERAREALLQQHTGSYDEEYRVIQPSGRVVWVRDRAVPVMNDAGEVYRIVGLAEDITERKEREHQIAVLDRVLRHNLRNDSNAIRSNAELILENGDPTSHARKIVEICDRLVNLSEKNRRIARDLTSVSHVERKDLATLLDSLVDQYRSEFPDVTIDCDGPSHGDVRIPTTIELAIAELIDNAIKHAETARPTVAITTTITRDEISISVADDGPTIPDDEWAVLGKEEEALVHSSGIGLWLVHWTVTNVGGGLTLEENDPTGNQITIHLPRKRVPSADETGSAPNNRH